MKTDVNELKKIINNLTFEKKSSKKTHPLNKISISKKVLKEKTPTNNDSINKENYCETYLNKTPAIETIYEGKLLFKCKLNNYYSLGLLTQDLSSLLITLMAEEKSTGRKERTKIDLYERDQVKVLSKQLAGLFHQDSEQIEAELLQLTNELEKYREHQIVQTSYNYQSKRNFQTIPPNKEKQILQFLKSPDLIDKIDQLIEKAGVVGEENKRKLLFVIASSYKTNHVLHCLVQGTSGSGKSHLINTIGQCFPPEDVLSLTRVTSKSFYYYIHGELMNKLLLIQDFDGLDDEAQYAFRELQSAGSVSSSTTFKDKAGNISSTVKTVNGHFASLLVTTKAEIYIDNMSRCIVTGINECKEQTEKIIEYQNKKMSGLINDTVEIEAKEFLQNCVRSLKSIEVVNPYADKIKLPPEVKMSSRLNNHFQLFVKQITLLNQYQRKKDPLNRLITEPVDIKIACDILFDSIMTKVDDMDSSLRQFFESIKEHIVIKSSGNRMDYEFSRREIRQGMNLRKTTCRVNLNELEMLEYIQRTGGYSNRGYKYKVIHWDDLSKLKAQVRQGLNEQLDNLSDLVVAGGLLQNDHQNMRGSSKKPLVVAKS